MSIKNALNFFSTISLEEMNNVQLMNRVETKFLLTINQLIELLHKVKDDYRVVRIDNDLISQYKTVYFDTEELLFYNEHHRQRNERYKIRFRNYVSSNLTFLEVKHKKNGRVNKKRIQIENDQSILDKQHFDFLDESDLGLLDLEAKLINHYKRITLVSKKSIERVTFDIDINFEFKDKSSSLENLVIVELKQAKLSRSTPIYKVLKKTNIKPFNISKYCIGLIKIYGKEAIKYNRFKKKLLKIEKQQKYEYQLV